MTRRTYVLPATIAERFGITVDELMRSRHRGLHPGAAGYTIPDPDSPTKRKLVFPSDLQPPEPDDEEAADPDES